MGWSSSYCWLWCINYKRRCFSYDVYLFHNLGHHVQKHNYTVERNLPPPLHSIRLCCDYASYHCLACPILYWYVYYFGIICITILREVSSVKSLHLNIHECPPNSSMCYMTTFNFIGINHSMFSYISSLYLYISYWDVDRIVCKLHSHLNYFIEHSLNYFIWFSCL